MSLWVLDTDMLTLWLRGQETIVTRVVTKKWENSGSM